MDEKLARVRVVYSIERGLFSDLELIDAPEAMEFVVPASSRSDAELFTKLMLCQYPNMKHPEVEFVGWQADDDLEVPERRENRVAQIAFLVLVVIAIVGYLIS